jgi:hypothetical protein
MRRCALLQAWVVLDSIVDAYARWAFVRSGGHHGCIVVAFVDVWHW